MLLAAALAVTVGLGLLPSQASIVVALDATGAEPSATLGPTPDPSSDPTPDPSALVDPSPSPDPTPTPEPTPVVESSPEPSPTPTPSPSPSPTPLPPGVIGPDGGTVVAGSVTLNVPAGAVGGPTRFTIVNMGAGVDSDLGTSLFGFMLTAGDDETGGAMPVFSLPLAIAIDASGWNLGGIDTAHLTIAELNNGRWLAIGAGSVGSVTAFSDHVGTFAVFGQTLPVIVDVDQTSDAPSQGRHRIEPETVLTVSISVRPQSELDSGVLIETIPAGWQLIDAGGGQFDAVASTVSWSLRSLPASFTAVRTIRAPGAASRCRGSAGKHGDVLGPRRTGYGQDRRPRPCRPGRAAHPRRQARRRDGSPAAGVDGVYLGPDQPLVDEPRYEVFRVRFDVRQRRWRPGPMGTRDSNSAVRADGAFVSVPAGDNVTGVAFYAAPGMGAPDPAAEPRSAPSSTR